MNKKMIDELEKVCTPVVELLRREYDPHCTIIIDSQIIRLVGDEVGIPYKGNLKWADDLVKHLSKIIQEQSKFVLETSEGVCKNPNEHTTPVNMENQEARKILEEQFKLLSKESKRCDHKCLHNITNAMLNIYATLYPCQYDSKEENIWTRKK